MDSSRPNPFYRSSGLSWWLENSHHEDNDHDAHDDNGDDIDIDDASDDDDACQAAAAG